MDMEFRNLTPFDALFYSAVGLDGVEHAVVAMKVAYRLVPCEKDLGLLVAEVLDQDSPPLCTADEFHGDEGTSSVFSESDLAPYKPRCDVLVRGHAHAPDARAASGWETRLQVSVPLPAPIIDVEPPRPLAPGMALTEAQQRAWETAKNDARKAAAASPMDRVLLDKRLQIHGPSEFRSTIRGWGRTASTAVTTVPLLWEYAFGGHSRVSDPASVDASKPTILLDEVCFTNPVGRGWIERRHVRFAHAAGNPLRVLPAPSIETAGSRALRPTVARHRRTDLNAREMVTEAERYGQRPGGLGPLGRSWAPRLPLAGTYDDQWVAETWPQLPADFDFGYWNSAPADQQIEFLPPNARIDLWHLIDPARSRDGHTHVELPGHRPFVLLRMHNGALLPVPLLTDTVLIDTDTMTIHLTHRISIPHGTPARAVEARFEMDPHATLVELEPAATYEMES